MPDNTLPILEHAWDLGPWLFGIFASIIALAVRNEYTTKKVHQALFDKEGDLKLVKQADCENCRQRCQEAFDKALQEHKDHMELERRETRQDIQVIHAKIDALPDRIITLLNARGTQ